MEIPPFFLPTYHSCTGYIARKLADSVIGNFQTEDRLSVRVAIYAARFFVQPFFWVAATLDIAFTAFIIPWSFLMSAWQQISKVTGWGYDEEIFHIFRSTFKHSLPHIPQAISLLFLPIIGTIYAISGKIIPVKIKRILFLHTLPTRLSTYKDDENPEMFTQLISEMPYEERMRDLHVGLPEYPTLWTDRLKRRVESADKIGKRVEIAQRRIANILRSPLMRELNFTHRFATRNAAHIRQLPKMHRLGVTVDITAMRIFQLMMQFDNGTTSVIIQRRFDLISKTQVVRSSPLGVINPNLNPCFISKALYDRECEEEVVAPEYRLPFSIRELQLAIDTIKHDCTYFLRHHLRLLTHLQMLVRDYMIGEDLDEHFQLLEWSQEKEKHAEQA